MQYATEGKLQKECRLRYQTLDNKIRRLTQQQTKTPTKTQFPPQSREHDWHIFLEPEMALLQKGPKYNLHHKPKNQIQNLALEAETAVSHLPS